jgi:hypothetical protein
LNAGIPSIPTVTIITGPHAADLGHHSSKVTTEGLHRRDLVAVVLAPGLPRSGNSCTSMLYVEPVSQQSRTNAATGDVVLALACLSRACTTFTSAPLAMSSDAK